MAKKYRSETFASIHETMEALHEIDAIDKQTMHEFDEVCLKSKSALASVEIKVICDPEKRS